MTCRPVNNAVAPGDAGCADAVTGDVARGANDTIGFAGAGAALGADVRIEIETGVEVGVGVGGGGTGANTGATTGAGFDTTATGSGLIITSGISAAFGVLATGVGTGTGIGVGTETGLVTC